MEKNGEFKPENETQAQKEHQKVVKTASTNVDIVPVITPLPPRVDCSGK